MRVISSEKKLCVCCGEEHDIKKVIVEEKNIFKGTSVNYQAEYFYCETADEFYMDEDMISSNDIRMKDAYRKQAGLLISDEILNIRAKYNISQNDLCVLLGWGGKTITRYESHQVQDKAHDTILKKLDQDPEWFIWLLDESRGSISQDAYNKYYAAAAMLYENSRDDYLRKAIHATYARIRNNEMYSGNAELSLDKVVDVIRYFSNSNNVSSLYKVKLMKLMWYADFLAYKQRKCAITGLVYQALPMGAVPIGHDAFIDLDGIEYDEIDEGDYTAYKFKPSMPTTYPSLSNVEIRILDTVIEKLGNMTKKEIVEFMHKEQAYIETKQRDIIQYKYASDLLL